MSTSTRWLCLGLCAACASPPEMSREAVRLWVEAGWQRQDEVAVLRAEALLLAEGAAQDAEETLPVADRGRAEAWRTVAMLHDDPALKAEAYEREEQALKAAGADGWELEQTLRCVYLRRWSRSPRPAIAMPTGGSTT